MAHFVNAHGSRISKAIVKAGIGQPITVGVYGADGLAVGPNDGSNTAKISRQGTDKNQFTWFRLTGARMGNAMVEAKMGGAVWDFFQLAVGQPNYSGPDAAWAKSGPGPNGRYTDNPNEVPVKRTVPPPADLVAMLRTKMPELNDNGARTLTAQCMHETGEGQSCWNWNLGNVKCKQTETNVPHHYLRDTWEIFSPGVATKLVTDANGLGYLADEAESKRRGWSHPGGKLVAVFEPPHYACRFRSYASLEDGARLWVSHHRGVAGRFPTYLDTVNTGDCAAVANILKRASYYSGSEGDYARNMTSKKAKVDRLLGPLRS